jgi:hypothetical protein
LNDEKPQGKRDEREPDEKNDAYSRFQELLEDVLPVPKEVLDKRREEYERGKIGKRAG